MRSSRLVTALAGLVIGLVVSVAAWLYFETVLLFLFLPFVPFLVPGSRDRSTSNGRPRTRRCPCCGYETTETAYDYCPRDGTPLVHDTESSRGRGG